jgi:hypothetical protein
MNDISPIWRFILSALAVWRLTHLLAEEDGPWDLIVRLRSRLGSGFFGSLMDCFYCLSLWFSLPFAIWLANGGWIAILLHWQALSGAACLLEKTTGPREIHFPVVHSLEGDAPCVVVKNEVR